MAFLSRIVILSFFFVLLQTLQIPSAHAVETIGDEDRIKALYLLNFANFVSWPDNGLQDTRVTVICSVRTSHVTEELQKALKEYKATHEIVLRENVPVNLIKHCHLLYLDPAQEPELATIFAVVKPYPILTVSEIPDFVRKGGMIGLLKTNKELGLYAERKITYAVNLKRALDVHLQLDPRLLELADDVEEVQP